MPPVGFKPAIPASERPQTNALGPRGHWQRLFDPQLNHYYYYRYSALGPVWAEARAQSGDWYSSGALHPGQVLRGSLPLLSPKSIDS